ncbi:MAG: hypothetical protein AAGG51_06650 [Cyanobacteria bacterium P01_G01_bin.54]
MPAPSTPPHRFPAQLAVVLQAAARAPGNQARFRAADLLEPTGKLAANWPAAFTRLSPLTQAELRAHPGQFLADATDGVYRGQSSGTEGESFTYFAGDRWNQQRVAARERSLAGWGLEPTIPVLNLASRLGPVRSHDISLVGAIDNWFLHRFLEMVQAQPVVVRGYPSRLCEVAIALHHCQSPPPLGSVVAVIATGECLFAQQRSLLSKIFSAPVINEYGCPEAGISGWSCPEVGRVHLDGDRCLYEVIEGQLLTTDLYNTTLPLVRYASGDALHLYPDPCPCGRPGPTAQIWGRAAEKIHCGNRCDWPGELELPPFPKILSYQLQIAPKRRRLWVQPTAAMTAADLTPLQQRLAETLGEQATEVIIEPPDYLSPAAPLLSTPDPIESEQWCQQVLTQPWSSWISQPPPKGEAGAIATLLQQLVAPRQIMTSGLPTQTVQLAQELAQSSPVSTDEVECLKIRVLLWAVSAMGDRHAASQNVPSETQPLSVQPELNDNPDARKGDRFVGQIHHQQFYLAILTRLQCWHQEHQPAALAHCSPLGFDLIAPLLTLPTATVQGLWSTVQSLIQLLWPQGLRTDAFTMHHYLAVLEQAGKTLQGQLHPWLPALRPLSAILLGDFWRCARQLSLSQVTLWAEILHNCPGAWLLEPISQHNTFAGCWQAHRQALLRLDRPRVAKTLTQLFNAARTERETTQCWLEKGYAALVWGETLEPGEWVEILRQQMGGFDRHRGQNGGHTLTNPLPWLPILNALAPKLLNAGQPDLAYACLFAAAPPNRWRSSFDRHSQGVNTKQSVIKWMENGF